MIATTTQSPPTLPAPHFWGHVGALRSDPLGKFEDAARLGHPVVRMAVGPVSIYLVLTPAAAHEVLVAAPDRFTKHTRGQELLRRTLGDSVLTTEGTDWRWRRRLQQPTFKRTAILGFADRMVERAQAWSDSLQRSSDPVDVAHGANDLTLQIAADALLGVELDAHDKRLVHEALAGILGGFFTLVTFPIPGADRLPLPAAVRHRRAVRTLREVVDRIVAQRRARGVGPDDTDVLGQLLNAEGPEGQRLSDDDLASEVVTLLLAGHETTANALSWTLGLLSRHPAIRRRVVAELNEVLGDRPATAADAHRLPLLDAVLRESMRLFPPVWSVSRSTIGPEVVAGMALPPKSFLFVST